MSAELNLEPTETELSQEQTEAYHLSQATPEQVARAEVSPKVLFLASQIGMKAAKNWQVRAEWTSVYLRAVGTSYDY